MSREDAEAGGRVPTGFLTEESRRVGLSAGGPVSLGLAVGGLRNPSDRPRPSSRRPGSAAGPGASYIGAVGDVREALGSLRQRGDRDQEGPGSGPKEFGGPAGRRSSGSTPRERAQALSTAMPLDEMLRLAAAPVRRGDVRGARPGAGDEPGQGIRLDPGNVTGDEERRAPPGRREGGCDRRPGTGAPASHTVETVVNRTVEERGELLASFLGVGRNDDPRCEGPNTSHNTREDGLVVDHRGELVAVEPPGTAPREDEDREPLAARRSCGRGRESL